jgi:hypothetical protein
MEYPKNTVLYPGNTFRRFPQTAFAAEKAEAGIARQNTQRKNELPEGLSLAMVYSPRQRFEDLFEPSEALRRGTLFCRLDMPFIGRGGKL